jgi:DNA gyrase subunit B
MDEVKSGIAELRQLVLQLSGVTRREHQVRQDGSDKAGEVEEPGREDGGAVFYSGYCHYENESRRWEPQKRTVDELKGLSGEQAAKILNALGNKQRVEILRAVLEQPVTGIELVEKLNMGTTGQLYHHLKALQAAGLLEQEERGGRYYLPGRRTLALLLLFAAVAELADTGDYLEMEEARNQAHAYLGQAEPGGYQPHLMLMAVMENSVMEHKAGFCSEIHLFLHEDGSMTVADNGRGIPIQELPHSGKTAAESVLTGIERLRSDANYKVPGGEKGISIAVVNALSSQLSVEIRREGNVHRQEYRHGIPQTSLRTVGVTAETGTSVTFLPDPSLFRKGVDRMEVEKRTKALSSVYPELRITIH